MSSLTNEVYAGAVLNVAAAAAKDCRDNLFSFSQTVRTIRLLLTNTDSSPKYRGSSFSHPIRCGYLGLKKGRSTNTHGYVKSGSSPLYLALQYRPSVLRMYFPYREFSISPGAHPNGQRLLQVVMKVSSLSMPKSLLVLPEIARFTLARQKVRYPWKELEQSLVSFSIFRRGSITAKVL